MPKSRPPSRPTAIAASSSGTDNQGRDLLSAMIYGARVSIAIGGGAVLLAATRRRLPRPSRGLFRRQGRCLDHAHRRRDPELPHDPARPSGERYRAGVVSAGGDGRMGAAHPDLRHRDSRMGAICPHRARRHHGGDGRRITCRPSRSSACRRAASCCGTSCRT